MLSTSERIEPVPAGQAVNEQELKQVIIVLPIDPRTNRIMLAAEKDDEEQSWLLPKAEVNRPDHQEASVNMEAYEQTGVRGQVIGCVGSFYECNKKGKIKSHIKVYELQIDELIKKWPGKKTMERRWFSYNDVMDIFSHKPYLIEAFNMSSLRTGIQP